MSWQQYVDTNLIGAGCATAAGIYDLQGNPWAYSPGFAAQIDEVAAVAKAMNGGDESVVTDLAGSGVVVAGVKYMFVRGDKSEVYVKKGNSGVVFHMCNTCMVVSYHDDKIQPGQCSKGTGTLTDYLKESGI